MAGFFVLAILPIVLAEFPPSTDLPQHISQVRLFLDTLKSPGGPFVIQGFAPNNLIYSLILILWSVLPVASVGLAAHFFGSLASLEPLGDLLRREDE